MASFFIPLTGLNADSTALNTIADDLSNMNTTGFKSQTVNFSDLFSQEIGNTGSGDPIQVGAGTEVANTETNFSAGTSNSTGLDTDVALQGNGFFVVQNGNEQYLTRDGNFSLDSSGNLITTDGMNVMGYPATDGVVNTGAPLVAINIPENETQAPSATTTFSMDTTLDSSADTGADSATTGPVKIYDSLGQSYLATVTYTKTGTNQWSYSISVPDTLPANTATAGTTSYQFGVSGGTVATVDPSTNLTITGANASGVSTTITAPTVTSGESITTYAADLQSALTAAGITGTVTGNATTGQLTITGTGLTTSGSVVQDAIPSANASGTLTFDSNGNLTSPSGNISGIQFAGLSDGASPLSMTWDLSGSDGSGSITQVAAASSTTNATQNGYAAGTYQSFSIGSDGTVTASFSNGNTVNVGQLALGTVANLQGLQSNANGEYSTTLASGAASIGVSGTGGLGTMEGGALEASNVNISQEFSDLIIAQRAFEANAKSVTTFDTVTGDTIQMVH